MKCFHVETKQKTYQDKQLSNRFKIKNATCYDTVKSAHPATKTDKNISHYF